MNFKIKNSNFMDFHFTFKRVYINLDESMVRRWTRKSTKLDSAAVLESKGGQKDEEDLDQLYLNECVIEND